MQGVEYTGGKPHDKYLTFCDGSPSRGQANGPSRSRNFTVMTKHPLRGMAQWSWCEDGLCAAGGAQTNRLNPAAVMASMHPATVNGQQWLEREYLRRKG